MWLSHLNDMEIPETKRFNPKGFELGATLNKPNWSILALFTHFTLHLFFLMFITTRSIILIPDDAVARNLIIIFNFSS